MENVAVLTEDGTFALFFRPHPWGYDRSRVPTPGNLPFKAKRKGYCPGVSPERGRVGVADHGRSWNRLIHKYSLT